MIRSSNITHCDVILQGWSSRWPSPQWVLELALGRWNLLWCQWARLTDTRVTFGSWHPSNSQKGLTWSFLPQQRTPLVLIVSLWSTNSDEVLPLLTVNASVLISSQPITEWQHSWRESPKVWLCTTPSFRPHPSKNQPPSDFRRRWLWGLQTDQ